MKMVMMLKEKKGFTNLKRTKPPNHLIPQTNYRTGGLKPVATAVSKIEVVMSNLNPPLVLLLLFCFQTALEPWFILVACEALCGLTLLVVE